MKNIRTYWREIILAVSMMMFSSYFTVVSFLRYTNFYAGRFDLGNMSQTVWNTLHGRIFQLTDPNGIETVSRLATHADDILVLLAPFYAIWSDPRMLLLIQVVVVALGAIFVYLLGIEVIKNKNFALLFALLYLLNPSVQRTIIYDFHAVVLSTTFLLGALYFLIKKNYFPFLLCAILAALTKEQVWLTLSFFGIYLILIDKKRLFGSILFLSSIIIFYYLVSYAIPQAAKSQHFVLSYYSDYGVSPTQIAKNILKAPLKSLATIVAPNRQTFIWQLLSPLVVLPLAAPLYLLFIIPELFLYLLSSNNNLHEIYYQYTATLTPFLFVAALYGFVSLQERNKLFYERSVLIGMFALAIFFSYLYSPLPFSNEPNLAMFTKKQENKQEINKYLASVPSNLSVATSNSLGSHLANRKDIYTIPNGLEKADLVLFMLNDTTAYPSPKAHRNLEQQLEKSGKYILDYQIGDFVVLKRIK
jgi:uncharacterized membrane protein